MNTENIDFNIEALKARITVLEDFIKAKHPDFPTTPKGTSGTLTGDEHSHGNEAIGYVVAKGNYANVRQDASLLSPLKQEIPRHINNDLMEYDVYATQDDIDNRINPATGKPYIWYKLNSGYVREDVVTFTPDKPAPITPIDAALWPAPVTNYTITNHDGHSHDGLDYSCAFGTPIQAGPNGGHVVKAFTCHVCNVRQGDGKASLQDPGKAFGYGSHVIVRYDYDRLPQGVKNAIPNGAYVYAIHAHLSKVFVSQGQRLDPYQIIGEVGATGNTYSIGGGEPSHLHFALRWSTHPDAAWSNMNNNRINPKLLVKA